MPREYSRQNAFAAGELSRKLWGRSDWDGYAMGSAKQSNFISMEEGGLELRPGTIRKAPALLSESGEDNDRSRLIEFNRSVLENYVIELADRIMRIWSVSTGDLVEIDGAALSWATPWPAYALGRLNFTRQADVMIVYDCGNEFAPYVIAHRGLANWTISPFVFRNGPFKAPLVDITASVSGSSLTTSADIFEPGHVGTQVWLRENPELIITEKWQVDEGVTAGDLREYAGITYSAKNSGTTGSAPPIHKSGQRSDGEVRWGFVHDGGAVVTLTSVSGPRSASFTVNSGYTLPSAVSSTQLWHMQAFNAVDGWPAACIFHQERLYFAGTLSEPDTAYGSVVSDYDDMGANFAQGQGNGLIVDDDGLRLPLADGSVDPTAWLLSSDELYAGGASGVRKIRGAGRDDVISAASAVARSVGTYGAAVGTQPVIIGNFILFIGLGRQRLRALRLDGEEAEASRHSDHLLADGILSLHWEVSNKTLWIVTVPGRLLPFKYVQEQGVEALAPTDFADGSLVESMCVVRRPNGVESLWLILRSFDAQDNIAREICVMTRRWDPTLIDQDMCYLDRAGYFNADAPPPAVLPPETGEPVAAPPIVTGGTGDNSSGTSSNEGYDSNFGRRYTDYREQY